MEPILLRYNRPSIYPLAAALIAAAMLSLFSGITGYARPVDTVTGEATEAILAPSEILANDQLVLQSIPSQGGTTTSTIGTELTPESAQAIDAAIQTYTDKGRAVSFILIDLLSGKCLYSNTALDVYSASCIKGPYLISCLMAGNAPTKDMYLAGHYSDNDAYSRIRKQYGSTVMAEWLTACDVDPSLARYNYVHLNAIDLAKMWLAIYPYIVSDETGSPVARKTLEGSLNSVLAAGPGTTRTVYSKAGWIDSNKREDYHVYNCGGIVLDENPYILVLCSNVRGTTAEAQALVDVLDTVHEQMIQ